MIRSRLPFDSEAVSTLLHGDCLKLMQELPDGCIDMVFCDLPYGLTYCHWDKTILPFADIWAAYKRLVKHGGAIVLTASQPFTSALIMSNVKMFKYCWIWEKNRVTQHLNAAKVPLNNYEDVCVFSDGVAPYNPQNTKPQKPYTYKGNKVEGRCYRLQRGGPSSGVTNLPRRVLKVSTDEGVKMHPTQKPVALVSYMIKTYTNPGDLVLDNCMGSGTTGVACAQTGRRLVGMELDADYYHIARDRINHALSKRRNIAKFNKGLTS